MNIQKMWDQSSLSPQVKSKMLAMQDGLVRTKNTELAEESFNSTVPMVEDVKLARHGYGEGEPPVGKDGNAII